MTGREPQGASVEPDRRPRGPEGCGRGARRPEGRRRRARPVDRRDPGAREPPDVRPERPGGPRPVEGREGVQGA
nr:hypothetical protein [Angustibacter aerolatus]